MSILKLNYALLIGLMATVASSLFLSSCDREEDPKVTKVYGTITMNNNETWKTWADSGVVEVTVFPKFSLNPMSGWGVVPDNTFGPGVLGGTFAISAPYNAQNPVVLAYKTGQNTYAYEIELQPGTYSALAVGFRHNKVSNPSKKTATLGVHFGKANEVSHGVVIKVAAGGQVITPFNYPAPETFTITDGEQREINFSADFDFVKKWYK